MNRGLDVDLILYGVMVAGLGVVAHRSAPDAGYSVLIAGIVGGVAAVFWGVLGLRGFRRRIWPISTLMIVDLVLLVQAVRAWLAVNEGQDAFKLVAAILTLLLVLGIGQLVNFMQGRNRDK
jgi:hypothetical protein